MPDSAGVYTPTDGVNTATNIWTLEKTAGVPVTASRFDAFTADLTNVVNNRICKDGTSTNITNLKLAATANSTTGVIQIGNVVFASLFGTGNAFGGGSGNFSLSTNSCTGFGISSFQSLSYGTANTAFGYQAAQYLQDGQQNVAIGSNALAISISDTANTAVGNSALSSLQGGGLNVAIGSGAGSTISTASCNVIIGTVASHGDNTSNQQIVIGWNCRGMPGAGSINIGGAIFGTGCTSTGTTAGTGKIGINTNAPTYELEAGTGDIAVATAGKTLRVKEGSNAKMGTATLTSGSATVSTTAVTANSRIFLTCQAPSGTTGYLRVDSRTAGTSFVIKSSSTLDASTVAWFIVEPY